MIGGKKQFNASKILIPAATGAGGFILGTKTADGLDSAQKTTQGFIFAGIGLLVGFAVLNPLLSNLGNQEESPSVTSVTFTSDSQANSFAKGQQESKVKSCQMIQRENTKGWFKKARIRKRIRENCVNLS